MMRLRQMDNRKFNNQVVTLNNLYTKEALEDLKPSPSI
jgi:hypothetical protein